MEKPSLGLPVRSGFRDRDDLYADPREDDGSLAWAEKQKERADKDRRKDTESRKFNCPEGL